MIVQVTRIARKGGYQNLERHLLDKHDENERIKILAGDRHVFADAQALADAKGCKYSIRHLSISPDRDMSPRQLSDFVRSVDAEFGIGDQRPRLVVLHEKYGRTHFHVAVAEIDPATNRVLNSRHDYARLERLAREYEAASGETIQLSRAERAMERIEGFSSKARHKAERNSPAFDRTRLKAARANGVIELQAELQRQGLSIASGDKGFILVTLDGQFVAAAHRATGLRKNEFKKIWEAYRNETKRPYFDGDAAGDTQHFESRSFDHGKRNRRNRQARVAPDIHPAAPNTADRSSPRSLRTRRAYYTPVAQRWANRRLLQQSLTTVDLDELLRWAEEFTASLMKIIMGPRQLLSARIHEARSGVISDANIRNPNGTMLRP
ncbi:relaxase/mobilization nuclease domain-containing protein [Hoeflea sp. IMCC20628]|uniref:relaxase/mobilization nuclease domain-containing protein n=1 Tax=Hoeflea sp. IMCC20628 TaxID=1620421 RepID=UPI00063B037A|nr:relaxase/mobilization nuclease domain-containing protein [Hoeflea sp. IMCC20628]